MSDFSILAQIVGIVASGVLIASYLRKTKKNFLALQIVCNILFAAQYALLGDTTTVAVCFVAIGKTILFYVLEKKNGEIPTWALFVSEFAVILCGIFTFAGPLSLIPILNACAYNYGAWQKDLKKTYLIGVAVAVSWMIYNFIIGAYVGAITSVVEATAGVVGFYRINRDKKPKKMRK